MTSTPSPGADRAELIRALAVLCEPPTPATALVAAALGLEAPGPAEHTDLFVQQLPPYASIYLDREGRIGGEALERIAGFWVAVGTTPPAEPDHLAALLGLWSALIESPPGRAGEAGRLLSRHAQTALVCEHLAPWVTPYLTRVAELAGTGLGRWSSLLQATIEQAAEAKGGDQPLPRHLAEHRAPPEHPGDLIPYLLTPIRSGIILTRADLGRAATELRLGLRVGERRFIVESLFDQDRLQMLRWLATEAHRQADRLTLHRGNRAVRLIWSERARETATMLEGLGDASGRPPSPEGPNCPGGS